MSRVYKARKVCPAVTLTNQQAIRIGGELKQLNGGHSDFRQISAKIIVEAARKKSSAMHDIIWGRSDSELAYGARCVLARQMVNSIRIVQEDQDGKFLAPPEIIIKPDPKAPRGYVPTEYAQASEYGTKQVEDRAFHRLNQWLDEFRAFRHGSRLGPLWERVRAVLKEQGGLEEAPLKKKK